MADKFRDTFPIAVDFVKGEQPSSDKFQGWAAQTNTGLQVMEKALGNLWGDEVQTQNTTGDPYMLVRDQRRTSQVVNLAALIGPASALNPYRVSDRSAVTVTVSAGQIPSNVNEFQLPFPAVTYGGNYPNHSLSVCTSVETFLGTLDSNIFSSLKNSKEDLQAVGDYYIDLNGRVFTYSSTGDASTWSGSYTTELVWDSYDQATPNVIPDINYTNGNGFVIVTDLGGGEYNLKLPMLTVVPGYDELGSAPLNVTDVAPAEYQAMLPYCLTNTLVNGDVIPDGFVQLWDTKHEDQTNGELAVTGGGFIDGLTFTYVDDNNLKVSGATLDVVNNRYRLITVGTNITETLQEVRTRVDSHAHDDPFGGNPVSHYNLSNNHIKPSQISTNWSVDVTSPASIIIGNDHPQYLCRYGWKNNVDPGQYDNAMLGDLFMAAVKTDYATDVEDYQDASVASRSIIFGASDGPSMYSDANYLNIVTTANNQSIKLDSINNVDIDADDNITLDTSSGYVAITSGDFLRMTSSDTSYWWNEGNLAIATTDAGQSYTLSLSSVYDVSITANRNINMISTTGIVSITANDDIILTTTVDNIELTAADAMILTSVAGGCTLNAGAALSLYGNTVVQASVGTMTIQSLSGVIGMTANGNLNLASSSGDVNITASTITINGSLDVSDITTTGSLAIASSGGNISMTSGTSVNFQNYADLSKLVIDNLGDAPRIKFYTTIGGTSTGEITYYGATDIFEFKNTTGYIDMNLTTRLQLPFQNGTAGEVGALNGSIYYNNIAGQLRVKIAGTWRQLDWSPV